MNALDIEFSLCEADRKTYGGDEWFRLDAGRLLDTTAGMLDRWEREAGPDASIHRAMQDAFTAGPASKSKRLLSWIARKQLGLTVRDDNQPETFAEYQPRTLQMGLRLARDESAPEPQPADETDDDGGKAPAAD